MFSEHTKKKKRKKEEIKIEEESRIYLRSVLTQAVVQASLQSEASELTATIFAEIMKKIKLNTIATFFSISLRSI